MIGELIETATGLGTVTETFTYGGYQACHYLDEDGFTGMAILECEGHADGGRMGETFFCDGTCRA